MEQEVTLMSLTAAEVPRCHPKTCWLQKSVPPPLRFLKFLKTLPCKWKNILLGCFGDSPQSWVQWLSPVKMFIALYYLARGSKGHQAYRSAMCWFACLTPDVCIWPLWKPVTNKIEGIRMSHSGKGHYNSIWATAIVPQLTANKSQ